MFLSIKVPPTNNTLKMKSVTTLFVFTDIHLPIKQVSVHIICKGPDSKNIKSLHAFWSPTQFINPATVASK